MRLPPRGLTSGASLKRRDPPRRKSSWGALRSSRPTDCRRSALRPVPQHRQQIQADQMRDALFLAGRLLTPELTAEHAGCRQFRRKPAPRRRGVPREWHLPEQVAGFFDSACDMFHVAPRACVTGCFRNARHACDARRTSGSTRNTIDSFCFAASNHCAPKHIAQKIPAAD